VRGIKTFLHLWFTELSATFD